MDIPRHKQANPAGLLESKPATELVRLYFNLSHLKQTYRRGWLMRGVPANTCESVADHSFAVAMLAMVLAHSFPELNHTRVLQLALLHDFGEIMAGDITPADGVPPEEKRARERDSFAAVLSGLPQRDLFLSVFEEYELGLTPEARFVRQLEKVEMALQASVYQAQGFGDFSEFLQSAAERVEDPRLEEILASIRKLRP